MKPLSAAARLPRLSIAMALAVVIGVALLARALGFEWVFVGADVYFAPADAQYHLRRAFYGYENFPRVLLFDPYINFPGGASVPWPPLYDQLIALVSRGLFLDRAGFERVAAWSGPILGALTVIPIHGIARQLAPAGVGVLAGLIFALLPASIGYSRVGNADHHSAVALIGACLLYCVVRLVRPGLGEWRWHGLVVGLAVGRLALLLTWHGSLLYLFAAEAILLGAGVFADDRRVLRAQSISAAGVLALLIPIRLSLPMPLGGPYSSIALSWLHVIAMLAVLAVSGGLALLRARGVGETVQQRALVAAALALGLLALLFSLPGPRGGLLPAIRFLTMSDGGGHVTGEQRPLFAIFGERGGLQPPELEWGWLAYAIPLTPLFALLHFRALGRGELPFGRAPSGESPPDSAADTRASALALVFWGGFFGTLAMAQQRYGNDFAPCASVLFALGAAQLSTRLFAGGRGERGPWLRQNVVAVVLVLVLMIPALHRVHWPRARSSWASLAGTGWPGGAARLTVAATLTRFARNVRATTPETRGYLDSSLTPEYGIIAHPTLGHAIQYEARRATATDPFWAYIGQENWDRTMRFLAARDEASALAAARELMARYVITMPGDPEDTVVGRLHDRDGSQSGNRGALEHFRLITEAPQRGKPISEIFRVGMRGVVPYKLFEIVPGARLRLLTDRGAYVSASLRLQTNQDRRFVYRATATADDEGVAHLVLPYPTDDSPMEPSLTSRAMGAYRIRVGELEQAFQVSEEAVTKGRTLELDLKERTSPEAS